MKLSKKVLVGAVATSIAAVSGIPVANAEIELGSGISVSGFIDQSFNYTDVDGADSTTKTYAIDQFETDFTYTGSDGVSANVDIEYGGTSGTETTFIEQAYVTKKFNDNFSVKAGRFLSNSGWEAEEPTGLYQYSGAGYANLFYGYYQQGVSAYYDGASVDFMVSVVNDAFNPTDADTTTLGTEVGVAIEPVEGMTAKLFYITNDDSDLVNFWTSYKVSGYTFAFEYNTADYANESSADGYLLMANYASGSFGVTLRYHAWTEDNAAGVTTKDTTGITLAPSYAIGSLLLIAEYRMDSFDAGGSDTDTFTIEALYTF